MPTACAETAHATTPMYLPRFVAGPLLYGFDVAFTCLFRERFQLGKLHSNFCSRRPVGDATCGQARSTLRFPQGKRLQDLRAQIFKTPAAPAVDFRSQSLVLRHICYIRAEESAGVLCSA